MKKIILSILSILMVTLAIPVVKAEESDTVENEKVKVYVFTAGGCGYCENELAYLKSLDSYNEKFEIVELEMYVDNVDWEKGKDYDIAVKVTNLFTDACFENVSYSGTPLVVISDIYALTSYNDDLESYINAAYERGDKDIVGCLINNEEDCKLTSNNCSASTNSDENNSQTLLVTVIVLVAVGGIALLVVMANKKD